jgi:CIC family chloride channel protein
MFLARRASEVMERDVSILPAETSFDECLRQPDHRGRMRHVVVTHDNRILGVLRVNTGLRRGLESVHTGIKLEDVARRNSTFVREGDVVFDVSSESGGGTRSWPSLCAAVECRGRRTSRG